VGVEFMRTMTFLDGSGDTTITWEREVDGDMKLAIQSLLDKGYVFFIMETLHDNKVTVKTKLTSVDKLTKRSIVFDDENIMSQLFTAGRISASKPHSNIRSDTVKRSSDADEIAQSSTIVTRPLRGG